jgi:hypothetical protein
VTNGEKADRYAVSARVVYIKDNKCVSCGRSFRTEDIFFDGLEPLCVRCFGREAEDDATIVDEPVLALDARPSSPVDPLGKTDTWPCPGEW